MARFLRLSYSFLSAYLNCPRSAFYYKCRDLPAMTTYPLLAGSKIHSHIASFHRAVASERPFFFKTQASACAAWLNLWSRTLQDPKVRKQLVFVSDDGAGKYYGIGSACVANYYRANFERPRPLEVESRYRADLAPGFKLVGHFDQLRRVSPEYIAKYRPDLMESGRLADGYDNVVIFDLKTDLFDYDAKSFSNDPTLVQKVRKQYDLHEGFQATIYTYLYEVKHGRKPIGFVWFHLRSGKAFFTYRENRDYQTLFDIIDHVVANIAAESFPKHVTWNCRTCPYLVPCREDRHLLYSLPSDVPDHPVQLEFVPNLVRKESDQQRRLDLRMPRQKAKKPIVTELKKAEEIVLVDLPWDGEAVLPKP